MSDPVSTLALAGGLSWASGVRLYLALFIAGWLGRIGALDLPASLQVLQSSWVLAVTGALCIVEFIADKVPGADSVWDAIHTVIRIPAGAVLAAASLGQMDPRLVTLAAIAGGTIAASAHATKAGSRALINTSPEPFSNWTASFVEDGLSAVVLWSAFFHPWIALAMLAVFLVIAAWVLPKLWRGLRWLFRRLAT